MARLWSSGFELNSTSSEVETTANSQNNTTTVRSGTYAARYNSLNQGGTYQIKSSNTQGVFYARLYFRVADLPAAAVRIVNFSTTFSQQKATLTLTTGGALQLFNVEDSAQIGSDSSALSLNTWYRLELKIDCTTLASTTVEAKIDGTTFASGTINITAGIAFLRWGDQTFGSSSFDFYFDDIAINDDSGSFQNSWPGEGEIIHLLPDGAGDTADWTGAYTDVDEVTPDDATSIIESTTLNQVEEVTLAATPAAMDSGDTINCVQVGVRFRADGAAEPSFVLRIKAAPAGTVEESGNITTTDTTWYTNASVVPRNYALTLYDLPGASTTVWTKSDLDTAQIGVKISADATDNIEVSTLWLLVDHKPGAGGGEGALITGPFMTVNTSFWGS